MEAFHKNIEGIRKTIAEKYAIVNPDTAAFDEYHKTLYLKVLCSLVQFHNESTEMQLLFLKRIVNGIGAEERTEEYMRRALEISEEDMWEFLSVMGKDKCKYYFALEGILLVSLGQGNEESYQYLAEMIELLDINKDDLTYVCLVARAVLQQQSSFYDEAKKCKNERVEAVDYAPYLKDFYYGVIVDNNKVVHYVLPDRKYSAEITFRTSYTEQTVIFENLNISVKKEWLFRHCKEVILYNCDFYGDRYSINFQDCQRVRIEKCRFHDFKDHVILQGYNIEVNIVECEFEDCYCKCWGLDGEEVGSVIHTDEPSKNAINVIDKTSFRNCIAISSAYNSSKAIISNCRCVVTGCGFYNCKKHYGDFLFTVDTEDNSLFLENTECSDNAMFNSVKLC